MVHQNQKKELQQPDQTKLWKLVNRTLVPAFIREQREKGKGA